MNHTRKTHLALALLAAVASLPASAANLTPYYLFDGDSTTAVEIVNGAVANTFSTFSIGYAPAIRSTIWLGDRDDRSATEYTLAGTPTGNTSVGGSGFSQLLDGAAGPTANYGIECCGGTNSVTVANTDWSNQTVLFNLPGGSDGQGIAYDGASNSLFVAMNFGSLINHYALDGTLLGSFNLGSGTLVGLAYEGLTDTLWGFNTGTKHLVQFNKTGTILQDFLVSGTLPGNPFGGEMQASAPPPPLPEPSSLALLAVGLGVLRQRRLHGKG